MVKVFITDVQSIRKADSIIKSLLLKFPGFSVNFDLEDDDRILRVEGPFFKAEDICEILKEYGSTCVDLPIDLSS